MRFQQETLFTEPGLSDPQPIIPVTEHDQVMAEIAAKVEVAMARCELTIGTASPERRLVDQVQRAVYGAGVALGDGWITADDVATALDEAGVDRTALAQRRRLASAVINGGAGRLWQPDGKVKSRDRRRNGREITRWRLIV